ncbi:pyruvate, phosphate dikinase, partial [candidate division GN15 bacterium]|nr:pyruvate, phosphate dikinase [candidate division GN15 bacterium]
MNQNNNKSIDHLLGQLQERAKELNCLYRIEEILAQQNLSLEEVCLEIIQAIPPGWQFPEICVAKIVLDGKTYTSDGFVETEWVLSADIVLQEMVIGTISVYYTEETPQADHGPFLKEEAKLIKTIADRLAHHVLHHRMKNAIQDWEYVRSDTSQSAGEWNVVLKMLRSTDRNLYLAIARKMLNHLCWSGVLEAEKLIENCTVTESDDDNGFLGESNQPHVRRPLAFSEEMSAAAFEIADKHLADDEIFKLIHKWIQEDKLGFLVQVVNRNLTLSEVADAIRRYHYLAPPEEEEIPSPSKRGVAVSLIRRFLSDQLPYINVAKRFIAVRDFYHLIQNVIFSTESHGKLGGKSAGLYLAAQILRKKSREHELLRNVKIPRTWHVTSDVLLHFMHHNNFDEVVEQKYKSINQVRLEYPHIVQTFKTARFPSDIVKGLSVALDDLGDRPLIVRSSSLLEDRIGAAFSGKYKSLFLANQGSKQKRLDALMDAIAEVYASTFSPDPIEYRAQRGLLDFGEEMGIIIQEVVGQRVGKYFLPAWAGVAFSNNEFRWSPRIKREDGLVRMVPGLGTRAVDRLGDDYPVLIAPGQPNLKVNVSPDETARYSPAYLDVINLNTNSFETVRFDKFIDEVQYDFPGLKDIISVYEDNHLRRPMGMNIDFDKDHLVATFDGLVNQSRFVKRMKMILDTLQEELDAPVDIEFASDGQDFYLLQCRPQSYSDVAQPSPIPKDVPEKKVVFSANRYVSNGRVPDITHIVFVDPDRYSQLPDRDTMASVGRAVGRLNQVLPKRQFVLMGPGRWGSRGDIKLGVSVTYSDINNTCLLM